MYYDYGFNRYLKIFVSTKRNWPCRKVDQCQPRITSQVYIVEPTPTMLHNPNPGSLNLWSWKIFLKRFDLIWAARFVM